MKKYNLFSLLAAPLLLLSSYSSFAEEYTITGPVENVSYNTYSSTWPCYIAVDGKDSDDKDRRNYFHASQKTSVCQFAERAKILNYNVKLYAKVDTGANVVTTIEFAGTKSRYWAPDVR